jgi:hypothetical protein
MPVRAGDALLIRKRRGGTIWTQTVTDRRTRHSVSYQIDMLGQSQHYAYFAIEGIGQNPVSAVHFTETTLAFASGHAGACIGKPSGARDARDTISPAIVAGNGAACRFARIVLHAPPAALQVPARR